MNLRTILTTLTLAALLLPAARAQKLAPGPQVMTFFSSIDDTEQPYGLYLPPNYDETKKYPLVMMLHGAGSNHRLSLRRVFGKSNANGENDVEATLYFPKWKDVDYIVASPYARGTMGYQGVAEHDVYDVLADVKKRFSIDEDRTYLTGLSMGGGGTLWIGLTHPDIWAAMFPVCPAPPRGTDDLAGNALNVPMFFHHGDQDSAVPVAVSREWTKKLKELGVNVEYTEYPGVNHNSWENAYKDEAAFDWFKKYTRQKFPDRVLYNSRNYKYNHAYWVTLDQLTPGTLATIDAAFTAPNQLTIKTTALGAFTLQLTGHPKFDAAKPLQVTLDGKKVKVTTAPTLSFQLQAGKWVATKYEAPAAAKKPGAEGPISAAFGERHVYVYGTAGNPSEAELKARMDIATQAANWSVYRNAFLGRIMVFPRVVSDKEVRPSDFQSSNLILFGTRETNTLVEKYSDRLPVELKAGTTDYGLFYVLPIDGRYVVINSGLPWWAMNKQTQFAFAPVAVATLGEFKDFALFKGSPGTIVSDGYFDNNWKLADAERAKLEASGVVTLKK
ncbi:prolyl oligopeptidase family serine peptidase [Fulvivirgaceae bacterium PWU5]|uniref:Prolyl oligopeptidase family serine peptidase n=1 Tax=Dawidia cretensis TaxID=2782350 RepID=A0AAP2GRE4_9BACT|nr:prolyl oligopeptidase family serine peptidase [Dawidia cretensis]MBT1710666.1 prolyl oligopeptidase family serine peptidase [Dawidia cretensis]